MKQYQVMFSCEKCGMRNQVVNVPLRPPNMDVCHYVEHVIGTAVQTTHAIMAPLCDAESIQDLIIPISNEEGAGIGTHWAALPDAPDAVKKNAKPVGDNL